MNVGSVGRHHGGLRGWFGPDLLDDRKDCCPAELTFTFRSHFSLGRFDHAAYVLLQT